MLILFTNMSDAEDKTVHALLLESRKLQFAFQMTTGFFYTPKVELDFDTSDKSETLNAASFSACDSIALAENLQARFEMLNLRIIHTINNIKIIESCKPKQLLTKPNSTIEQLENRLDINQANIRTLKLYQKSLAPEL